MGRLLEGKNAIIYGGGGGIGSGSAGVAVVDALDEGAVDRHVGMAALRRAPWLADVTEVAAFLASDSAGGMTGAMTNVTSGLVLR
jgi:enoyl-[acyl-carrier-protein] reductase (NADH)